MSFECLYSRTRWYILGTDTTLERTTSIPALSENGQLPRCLTITVLIGLYINQQLYFVELPRVTVFLPKMAVSVGLRLLQFVRSPLFLLKNWFRCHSYLFIVHLLYVR
jgi:hypothetical protein